MFIVVGMRDVNIKNGLSLYASYLRISYLRISWRWLFIYVLPLVFFSFLFFLLIGGRCPTKTRSKNRQQPTSYHITIIIYSWKIYRFFQIVLVVASKWLFPKEISIGFLQFVTFYSSTFYVYVEYTNDSQSCVSMQFCFTFNQSLWMPSINNKRDAFIHIYFAVYWRIHALGICLLS